MNQTMPGQAPKRSNIFLWVGFILMLFGVPFIAGGWFSFKTERDFEQNSIVAQGAVISKYVKESWDSDHKSKSRSYIIKYRFTPAEGKEIESESSVANSLFDETFEGAPINIQYLPSDISKNRVDEGGSYVFAFAFLTIGSLISLAGLALLRYEFKTRALHKRLNRDGILVEAVVTSVGPGNLSINNVQQWLIGYSYKDMRGVEQVGTSPHMTPDDANQFAPGDKGKVRYDKNDSTVHIWVGR